MHTNDKKKEIHCPVCGKQFKLAKNRNLHKATHSTLYECRICGRNYTRLVNLRRHMKILHMNNQRGGQSTPAPPARIVTDHATQTAINNKVQIKTLWPRNHDRYDLLSFLASAKEKVKGTIRLRARHTAVKWYVVARVQLYREDNEGNVVTIEPYIRSVTYRTLTPTELTDHHLNEAFQKVMAGLEKFIHESSGWIVKSVKYLQVHTIDYTPLAASSFIELPTTLKRSKSILNIKNEDNSCFIYCILAKLFPHVSNPHHASSYITHENELKLNGLTFPMTLSQINKFERLNKTISVNVFGFENSEIIPLRIAKNTQRQHHINLLHMKTDQTSHYCLIREFDTFLGRTKSRKCKHFFCYFCLNGFTNKKMLIKHIPLCRSHGAQKVVMPIQGHNDTVSFKDYLKQMRLPFVIYCDFETLNRRIDTCENAPNKSQTVPKKLLDVSSFGYKVVCSVDSNYTKSVRIYRGKDASSKFLECLLEEQSEIQELLKRNEPIKMTCKDIKQYQKATHCYICGGGFEEPQDKCRDHCHLSGKYRGASHMTCNLVYKTLSFIPVVIHNLRGFDGHLIAQSLGQFDGKISCIPQNLEKYLSFSFQNLRFIDSLQFLSASLDALVVDLKMDTKNLDYNFRHFFSEFNNREDAKGLLQKNAYPYDYMDCETKFEETRLPPIDCFYSSIKNQGISQDEYNRACQLFDYRSLRNLGEWSDLYLKTDVLLLCSVFENFRDVTMDEF